MSSSLFNYNGKFIIALATTSSNDENKVKEILSECWSMKILNVNVLPEDASRNSVQIYTYFPYTSDSCNNVTPFVWNTFSDGYFRLSRPIFARRKLINFHYCPLKIATSKVPLCAVEWHANNRSWKGFDGNIIENLEKLLNFTTFLIRGPGAENLKMVKLMMFMQVN